MITLDGFYPVRPGCRLTVRQPLADGATRTFDAALLGVTFDRGELLSYRLRDASGETWLVPRHWIVPSTEPAPQGCLNLTVPVLEAVAIGRQLVVQGRSGA